MHDVAKQNYFIHVSSNVLHLHALAQHGKNVQICMAVDALSYVGLLLSSILPDGIEQPIVHASHTLQGECMPSGKRSFVILNSSQSVAFAHISLQNAVHNSHCSLLSQAQRQAFQIWQFSA